MRDQVARDLRERDVVPPIRGERPLDEGRERRFPDDRTDRADAPGKLVQVVRVAEQAVLDRWRGGGVGALQPDAPHAAGPADADDRSEEHTSELQSTMRI